MEDDSVENTQGSESENGDALAEADQFLLNFSQASAEQLEGASLRNEWLSSKHMLGINRSMQVAQLVIFASKAGLKEISELRLTNSIDRMRSPRAAAATHMLRCPSALAVWP